MVMVILGLTLLLNGCSSSNPNYPINMFSNKIYYLNETNITYSAGDGMIITWINETEIEFNSTGGNPLGNCSIDNSCDLIAYDSEISYIQNCSVDNSCSNITYDSELVTIYHNATEGATISGTVISGTLIDTQHPTGNYDDTTFNFSEQVAAPALDMRMNFTGITDFSKGVIRYRTTKLKGDYPIIQLWDYDDSKWEDYPLLGESESFATIEQSVYDDDEHIENGIVQMRLYKSGTGNTQNKYYVDWIALIEGMGVTSGQEIDPYALHRDGSNTMIGNLTFEGQYNRLKNGITYTTTYIDVNASIPNMFADFWVVTTGVVTLTGQQPDYSRPLSAECSSDPITPMVIEFEINGTETNGYPVTETWLLSQSTGATTQFVTNYSYVKVDTIEVLSVSTGFHVCSIGISDLLGLPNYPFNTETDVFKVVNNGRDQVTYSVIPEYGIVNLTGQIQGLDDLVFFYRPYKE